MTEISEREKFINRIEYYHENGGRLWSAPMNMSHLWRAGDGIVEGGKPYTIKRVAIVGDIQVVNLAPGWPR